MENTSKHLILSTLSGSLKPQVRLGVAVSEFAQALDEDRKKKFRQMQNASNYQLSGLDVIKVTEEINKDGERRHSAWRPYGTKVYSFLSRLQMFASVGDVMIGGSQNLIATGVWCAAATNFLGYFEKLTTLFMDLSTSWTLHKDYAELFGSSEVLQNHLCEYLIILMRLCRKVVLFTQKSTTAQLFSSLGASFDVEIVTIQKEMEMRGHIIQHTSQQLATKSFLDSGRCKVNDSRYQILQRLSPGQAQYDTTWRRQRRKGTCNWIREMQHYQSWSEMRESSTICISGKLGSGKTVALANLTAEMNIRQPCAFFFCTFKDPETLKAANILGSIAFHILNSLPAKEILWDDLAKRHDILSGVLSPDVVIDLILELAPRKRRYAIVIDGLEDCPNEDMTDVFLGLKRLLENRIILLCYSVRSDSRFEQLARTSLATEFYVSLDESKHSEEIQNYIRKEVRCRNVSGHLSSELEDIIITQLILGSQGMSVRPSLDVFDQSPGNNTLTTYRYLWVSLQLDAIFPNDNQTVTTDEHILGFIMNLPKDLPEAFERALEGIADKRYEGKILKLVMAATSPLTLDEIRLALTITPGEPIWHSARLPHDGHQLISLCGGNLLEVDEEDTRVRFIHHSVIQHLLRPATWPITVPYHFSDEDAENFIGSVCVTYLNLAIFDSRLTVTRKINSDVLAGKVDATIRQDSSTALISRMAQYFKSRERTHSGAASFDIGRVATEVQALRQRDRLDPLCFKGYAVDNWLFHTRCFLKSDRFCDDSWSSWWRLLSGATKIAHTQFPDPTHDPIPALRWAIAQGSQAVFVNVLTSPQTKIRDLLQLSQITSDLREHQSIHGTWLGDILAQITELYHKASPAITRNTDLVAEVRALYALGANPIIPHHESGSVPVQNVIRSLIASDDNDMKLSEALRFLLSEQAARDSLHLDFVPLIVQELIVKGKEIALRQILEFRPDLRIDPHEDSMIGKAVYHSDVAFAKGLLAAGASATLSLVQGRPAIQYALENQHRELIELLGKHGAVNIPTSDGTSLVWTAIQNNMENDWVSRLLNLGANPNAGPFLDTLDIYDGLELDKSRIYPLQAALRKGRTLLCLALLAHGADTHPPSGPNPLDMAIKNGDEILVAALRVLERKEFTKEQCRQPDTICTPTALLAALLVARQMATESYDRSDPTSTHHDTCMYLKSPRGSWKGELCHIIRFLTQTSDLKYLNAQDHDGYTALHYLASWNTDLNVDELLLKHGADSSMRNHSGQITLAIAYFTDTDFETIINPFSKSGANIVCDPVDPNLQDENGNTALHHSVTDKSLPDIGVERLLDRGSDPNVQNHLGETPIHVAAGAGLAACMKLKMLLDRGGDANSETVEGESPLGFAISRGYRPSTAAVRILLEAGANPKCALKRQPEVSLLERAITHDFYPDSPSSMALAQLLRAGANPYVPSSTGKSLEEFARERGQERSADILRRYMTKEPWIINHV